MYRFQRSTKYSKSLHDVHKDRDRTHTDDRCHGDNGTCKLVVTVILSCHDTHLCHRRHRRQHEEYLFHHGRDRHET